ncbi:hypothetical protein [Legionella longbeachae]|uniref:Uncharacterized protein n=1 Tax=Legionella longbeachae serogroup 1 (strain NSW150) TaxID=661367 RepID=D3HJ72_LEGLN|nr:hypothetical protein [Legionella longbeachae]VEE02961.1 Uncharacterised protein [Legionella oakridgensis]HBD7398640.1 hypothetical protein [Legionella pneumophila]ARB90804.1 hypothetical protein A6J40_00725 [Legionella longbeachae]ARM32770.1 hypothetical protein B0B39_04220 [Legionella longbeachae]EEZ94437.1 conserved hypothetical protein [Legionella longbeachae D-4968]
MKSITEIKELLAQVDKPGTISEDLMAFFLHLKENSRVHKKADSFNAFAMSCDELDELAYVIEQMIENCDEDLRFQIAISKWDGSAHLNHWSFLEFDFKAKEFPALDILICDPLGFVPSLVLTNLIANRMTLGRLSKLCNLHVYVPTDVLQNAGRGCAYFTTDSIAMLSNQNKYNPIYDYMRSHQQKEKEHVAKYTLETYRDAIAMCYTKEDLEDMYNFNLIVGPLPVRLLRTKQSVSSLEKEVLESTELSVEVVNNKGDRAWKSIEKYLFFVDDRTGLLQHRNMRVNKKMEKLGEKINTISSSFSSEEDIHLFNEKVDKHRLLGLAVLVEKHFHSKCEDCISSTLG